MTAAISCSCDAWPRRNEGVSLARCGPVDRPSLTRLMSGKQGLSESDICMKFIDPAIQTVGWNLQTQVRREVTCTDGKAIVRGVGR